jgi:hypothetical protein
LGSAVCKRNGTIELTEGYGIFGQEVKNIAPQYEPETVDTDGSSSTQSAWKAVFCNITIIQCFLHAFINIRDRCKKRFTEFKNYFMHVPNLPLLKGGTIHKYLLYFMLYNFSLQYTNGDSYD